MNKIANFIEIRAFSNPEDDYDKVYNAFISLLPSFEYEEESKKPKPTVKNTQGFEEKTIRMIEIKLEKNKHINDFIKKLASNLSDDQKELLVRQADSRLDEHLHFFLRLDKEKLQNNEYLMTDSGDCYHVKIGLSCFPAKREKAIELIGEIFGKT
ncbi:RNA-binding domain-containing protein [Nanoarchaeota archaeon]